MRMIGSSRADGPVVSKLLGRRSPKPHVPATLLSVGDGIYAERRSPPSPLLPLPVARHGIGRPGKRWG